MDQAYRFVIVDLQRMTQLSLAGRTVDVGPPLSVFRVSRIRWGEDVDPAAVEEANPACPADSN